MHRLDRRLHLYRGRPRDGLPPSALASADGPRERAARLVRGALRTGRPVVVRHARWSAVPWWLDDLAIDLQLDARPLDGRRLELAGVGRGDEGWIALPDALSRCLGVASAPRAQAPTNREAFRVRAGLVLRKARSLRRRKVVLCVGADALGYELLQDLCAAWEEADTEMTPGTSPLLVLACATGGQSLALRGAFTPFLADPDRGEAVRMVAEILGGDDVPALEALVDAVGTVPAFLLAAARGLLSDRSLAPRDALGGLQRELADAVGVALTRDEQAERLETLANGPAPYLPAVDNLLLRGGLVTTGPGPQGRQSRLRSPLIAEIVRGT